MKCLPAALACRYSEAQQQLVAAAELGRALQYAELARGDLQYTLQGKEGQLEQLSTVRLRVRACMHAYVLVACTAAWKHLACAGP